MVENTRKSAEADFQALGVATELIAALDRLRIDAPTEIQQKMLPCVLDGRDVLARACTGAGKTNTYLLPILQTVEPGVGVQVIVIQPTRSLALQFQRNLKRFEPERKLKAAVVGGGRGGRDGEELLADNPDVIITIPRGAALLAKQAGLDLSTVKLLVIDEVDAIIDERGADRLREAHELLEHKHQTVMLSGVLSKEVRELASVMLNDATEIETEQSSPRAFSVSHSYYAVTPEDKFEALLSFCKQMSPKLAIVFANTEEEGREIAHRLGRAYVNSRWIDERHGRGRRDRDDRRSSRSGGDVIVACDPPPRRLSTIPATHLLHYDLPEDVDAYTLRLRQASRLRRTGEVVVFMEADQQDLLAEIEERIGKSLKKREPLKAPERSRRQRSERSSSGGRRDGKSDEGRRGGASRSGGKSDAGGGGAPPAKPADAPEGRHDALLHRNKDLDARGVKPPPRTLGSRFRTNRRPKQLRRPN